MILSFARTRMFHEIHGQIEARPLSAFLLITSQASSFITLNCLELRGDQEEPGTLTVEQPILL